MIDAVEADLNAPPVTEAPSQPLKRGRGRPRKVRPPQESGAPETAEATDRAGTSEGIPPFPEVGQNVGLDTALEYWNRTLTAQQRQCGTLYLYRDDPILLRTLKRGRLVNENIRKYEHEHGEVTRETIRNEYRAGRYILRLTQRVVEPHGQLFEARFKIEGDYANLDEAPILDLNRLDWDHPDNKHYVRLLKLRGVNPPGSKTAEETEDMAASEVLGEIAGKALDVLADRPAQQAAAAATAAAGNEGGGVGRELVGLLREQITQNKPPAQQGSMTDHVKSLVDIAEAMRPEPVDLGPIMELQRQNTALIERMMQKDIERAEKEAQTARAELTALKEALPKAKTIDQMFDELESAAQRYKRIRGDDEERAVAVAPEPAGGIWGSLLLNLPAILEKGALIAGYLANMTFNYAVAKTAGPGASATSSPVNPQTGAAGKEPAEPELSPEQQEQAARMQAVIQALVPLAQPMLTHLRNGRSGTDFAKWVHENFGPQTIAIVQQVDGGRNTILSMLQNYPPVWSVVGGNAQTLEKFTLFLDQFLTYQVPTVQ